VVVKDFEFAARKGIAPYNLVQTSGLLDEIFRFRPRQRAGDNARTRTKPSVTIHHDSHVVAVPSVDQRSKRGWRPRVGIHDNSAASIDPVTQARHPTGSSQCFTRLNRNGDGIAPLLVEVANDCVGKVMRVYRHARGHALESVESQIDKCTIPNRAERLGQQP